MIDLPNNQSAHDSSSDKDGAYQIPAGPEGVRVQENNNSEKSGSVEKSSINPETLKIPEAPSLNEQISTIQPQSEEKITTLSNEVEDNPQIVDKTNEPTTTHKIKTSGDKLTKEADEEEEHFIEEVEKHHGHL